MSPLLPQSGAGPGKQHGLSTVEFALVGTLVFFVLFGVMEVARLMYTWNLLNEVSRRAARLATVCRVQEGVNGTVASAVTNQLGGSLPGFTAANVSIVYLDKQGAVLNDPGGADAAAAAAGLIRSSVVNYRYQSILPITVDLSMFAPGFSSTLRAESLGKTPNGDVVCDQNGGVTLL